MSESRLGCGSLSLTLRRKLPYVHVLDSRLRGVIANGYQLLARVAQLTGKRLPDPTVSTLTTLADLYNHFITKSKPKTVAQTKEIKMLKFNAPNVTVHETRRTPIHKERSIGRWKVIEAELLARDLPVTGSKFVGAKAGWR
jgi:hypothetical protein